MPSDTSATESLEPVDPRGGGDRHPKGHDSDGLLRAGEMVGSYRIVDVLGEGGFGVVYRALQLSPVRREVALKVIKPGMDSRAVLGRFEAERQALAMMDHACVAKVFDGGVTERGQSYFVMELVRGEPITTFCDRVQMPIRERIELFARVCGAVQHAHSKGVVHRDLKPSNILVSYEGQEDRDGPYTPKVIDFGVAKSLSQKLTEASVFTGHGQMIGTPEYMSPEQAEMSSVEIDRRSDVYSLGVVMYELLTGVRPFDLQRVALAEMQRVIREVEPQRPSTRLSDASRRPDDWTPSLRARGADARTLSSALRHDLDWVVMKCLEKDRTRRYSEASEIASEISRYLSNQPVLAGPPSVGYRARKLLVRCRRELIGAAVVIVLGVGGVTATLYQRSERSDAEEGREVAVVEAASLAGMLREIREVRARLDAAADVGLERAIVLDREDRALRSAYEGRPEEELKLRLERARAALVGRDWIAALVEAERGVALLELIDEPGLRDEISAASRLGSALRQRSRLSAAVEAQQSALAVAERLGDTQQISVCEYNLANALRSVGRYDEAERLYESTLTFRRETYGEGSEQAMRVLSSLAILFALRGEVDRAETLIDEAITLSDSVDERPRWLQLRQSRMFVLERAGRAELVMSLAGEIEDEMRARGGGWRVSYLLSWMRAARSLDEWEEVARLSNEGLLLQAELGGSLSVKSMAFLGSWALAMDRLGNTEASAELAGEAARIRSHLMTDGDPGLQESWEFRQALEILESF